MSNVSDATAALIVALRNAGRMEDAASVLFSMSADALYGDRADILESLIRQVAREVEQEVRAEMPARGPARGAYCLRLTGYDQSRSKIDAIKELRLLSRVQGDDGLGLKEAKDAVEATGTRNPLVPDVRGTYEEMRSLVNAAQHIRLSVELF
jgi:hypothetical protein